MSKKVREALEGKEGEAFQLGLFGSRFAGLLLATDLMRYVGELSDVISAQVQESRAEYRKASDALSPFKRILDTYTSQWFSNGVKVTNVSPKSDVGAQHAAPKSRRGGSRTTQDTPALAFLKSREAEAFTNARDDKALKRVLDAFSPQDHHIAETALTTATEKHFFHWELEFPEVFYGPRPGSKQLIERLEGAGFDAVIGNPPWGGLRTLGDLEDALKSAYVTAGKAADWFALFLENTLELVSSGGCIGQVIPGGWQTAVESKELRKLVAENLRIQRFVNLPYDVFPEAYTEAVIITGQIAGDTEPAWRSANPRILICDRREKLSELSDSDPRWFTVACADWFKIDPANFPFFTF